MPKKVKPIALKLLQCCARCGKNHTNIIFQPLKRPGERHTHWAPCPTNGEPVMLVVVPDKPKKKK